MQADLVTLPGKADMAGEMSNEYAQPLHRGSGGSHVIVDRLAANVISLLQGRTDPFARRL